MLSLNYKPEKEITQGEFLDLSNHKSVSRVDDSMDDNPDTIEITPD